MSENSFIPALKESERFINFMVNRFKLDIKQDYVITINKTSKNTIGYFMPKESPEHYKNTKQDLNNINLNTLYIKDKNPYEVLTHELAHFINKNDGVKGCSSNQYHNKHFKEQAKRLGLECVKSVKGFAQTKPTEAFKEMLKEFKPQKEVFDICQNIKDTKPKGSRLRLWECGCGVKVRCASDDLQAKCLKCDSLFKQQ